MTPQLLDSAILLFIGLSALVGVRFGFLRATVGLICAAIVVAVMLFGYPPLSGWLERSFSLSARSATIVAFIMLALVGQLLAIVIQRPLTAVLAAPWHGWGWRWLNAAAGALPGVFIGLLIVGLGLGPLAVVLPATGLGTTLRDARLAPVILDANARLVQDSRVRPLLQSALDALALPATHPSSETGIELPFRVPTAELAPDPQAEGQLLALINDERVRAGLPPLTLDQSLVPVARAHAMEMFEAGYFSHDSPRTGSPFDRLDAAGIPYLAAGENLAFAPDVTVAHRGLMNSPGHRANILSPEFGRVGIGIIRSRYHGLMIVQLFRD